MLSDFNTLIHLTKCFRSRSYDQVFTYFLKPNIWGNFAAFFASVPNRVLMIEGLGYLFTKTPWDRAFSFKTILRLLVLLLYRVSFLLAHKVILLNPDDLKLLKKYCSLPESKTLLLGGIGVDVDYWVFSGHRPFPPTFIMVARLLREKGVLEYLNAASIVKRKFPDTNFLLLGSVDSNPGSISLDDISAWIDNGTVKYLGHVDVLYYLSSSTVFVLPSYREGVPRSTQEALSVGLPVITTDVPGCRSTVRDGVNGFLIPPFSSEELSAAMCRFVEDPALIPTMGYQSRKLAELSFDVSNSTERLFEFAFSHLLSSS